MTDDVPALRSRLAVVGAKLAEAERAVDAEKARVHTLRHHLGEACELLEKSCAALIDCNAQVPGWDVTAEVVMRKIKAFRGRVKT